MRSRSINFLRTICDTLLDALFPVRCVGCGTYDTWLCTACHSTLPILTEQQCPICKKHTTVHGAICHACNISCSDHAIDSVFITSYYRDPLLKKAIHYFKYRFVVALAEPLALLMAQAVRHSTLPIPDVIIPVPLHKRRMRWRGFNQAQQLAQALDLRIPLLTDILIRKRYTAPQASMKSRDKRQKNLLHAFYVQDPDRIKNKTVLLIDDVMTTGTTLKECARTLKDAGAKKVHCLVLARE